MRRSNLVTECSLVTELMVCLPRATRRRRVERRDLALVFLGQPGQRIVGVGARALARAKVLAHVALSDALQTLFGSLGLNSDNATQSHTA